LASEKLFGGGDLVARNPERDRFILWHWRILSFLASSGEAAGVYFLGRMRLLRLLALGLPYFFTRER